MDDFSGLVELLVKIASDGTSEKKTFLEYIACVIGKCLLIVGGLGLGLLIGVIAFDLVQSLF